MVIGRGILHHLEQPTAVLARVGRALVAGGRVAFMDPNPLNPAWIPFVTFHPALSWSVERHLLRGTPWRSRGILESCGFESVKIEFAGLVPPPLWGRVGWAADLEDRLGSWRFLHRLAIYLMVAGRKPHGS